MHKPDYLKSFLHINGKPVVECTKEELIDACVYLYRRLEEEKDKKHDFGIFGEIFGE